MHLGKKEKEKRVHLVQNGVMRPGARKGESKGTLKTKYIGEPEKTRWNQKMQRNNKILEEQKG